MTAISVREAGNIIAKRLTTANDDIPPDVLEAFRLANDWRNLHALPMKSIRLSMMACMRSNGIIGDTGARLKRMPAIRGKLQRGNVTLDKLQDLGGCRAIVTTIEDARRLAEGLRNYGRHQIWKENDYIGQPKHDGYRSHHMAFTFQDRHERSDYNGRRIEVQVRTRLQHSWATAVEAVGRLRDEYLKGSQGNPKWLRLFILMSAEFAAAEGLPDAAEGAKERQQEICEINDELGAVGVLDNIAHVVHWVDKTPQYGSKPSYYLIRYDGKTGVVNVESKFIDKEAFSSYLEAERAGGYESEDSDAVLVDAAQVDALRYAFPNYFGDVQMFKNGLSMLVKGEGYRDFVLKAQQRVVRPREPVSDLRWLRGGRRWPWM